MNKNYANLLFEHERIIRFFDELIKNGNLCYGGINCLDVKEWAVKGIESELRKEG